MNKMKCRRTMTGGRSSVLHQFREMLPGKESLCPETSGSPFCSSLGGENEEQEEGSSAAARVEEGGAD